MKDIKLVIHCADIHIRNVQRHEEYAQQLERFVEKCKEIAAPSFSGAMEYFVLLEFLQYQPKANLSSSAL